MPKVKSGMSHSVAKVSSASSVGIDLSDLLFAELCVIQTPGSDSGFVRVHKVPAHFHCFFFRQRRITLRTATLPCGNVSVVVFLIVPRTEAVWFGCEKFTIRVIVDRARVENRVVVVRRHHGHNMTRNAKRCQVSWFVRLTHNL